MEQATIERVEHVAGGKGYILKKHILSGEALGEKCRMYAQVTLPVGCSIGYHPHQKESETYYILSGQGEYTEDGKVCTVAPGDITYTKSGSSHGIENTGTSDLIFMAIILKD